MPKLNLLVHLDNFRWTEMNLSRSLELDSLAELIEEIGLRRDKCWHHPACYSLCYDWGCMHELIEKDFRDIQALCGWMTFDNHKTLIRFWRKIAFDQKRPFSNDLQELIQNNPNLLNGLFGYSNDRSFDKFVSTPKSRHDLEIHYCSQNNDFIQWNQTHDFLPNLEYSNEFMAERLNILNTDLKERSIEITKFAQTYCTDDYRSELHGGRTREALAAEVGEEVALRNFYQFEKELSAEEARLRGGSLRSNYSIRKDGRKMYLSIDFEKTIAFEWCNHAGVHLGEYRFDGRPNGQLDDTGAHDIWALR